MKIVFIVSVWRRMAYKRHSDYTYNDYNTCRADVYIQRCELRQKQQYYVDEEFPNDRGVIKPPLATRERLSASVLSICLFVCLSVSLSVAKMQKNAIFSKTKQFRAMVSIDHLWGVVHRLFKEPIIEP